MALMKRFESPKLDPFFGVLTYFVTFFLVGAWHGQTSEFLFFGVLQGGGVAFNKLYQIEMARILGKKGYLRLCDNQLYCAATRGLTFAWFSFTLLWFWSDWHEIITFGYTLRAGGLAATSIVAALGAVIVLSGGIALHTRISRSAFFSSRYVRTALISAVIVILITFNFILTSPTPQIVYKTF
jgi:alginate O-acetyltransferase complex protein AlgI